jgi:hypothetical protein
VQRLLRRGVARQAEVGLHLASFLGQDERQHRRWTKRASDPGEQPRPASHAVGGQRPSGFAKQLFPARRVAIFDDGEAREEVLTLGVLVRARELTVEPRGVFLVGVVLVPAGVHGPTSVLE